jgi:hypothetical protein
MNSEITENVQKSIRPGAEFDSYYYGDSNSMKQEANVIVNNKFKQAFSNPNGGTSQFTLSPYGGMSDVLCYFKMGSCATITNAFLPQGWGYSLIKSVSVRYGSSAQYFFSSEQIYLQSLFDCEDGTKRDSLSQLGGAAQTNAQLVASPNPEAYVYLKLPHTSPRADGKPLPFPSDLLVQPIIITIELNTPDSVFVQAAGAGAITNAPTALAGNFLQVKQEMMEDSANLLARKVDMNSMAYTYPLMYFPNQEVQINCGQSIDQSVNLTGFKNGEVQRILLWLTSTASEASNGSHNWLPISDVTLTYNGEIFFRSDSNSAQFWNLIADSKSAGVNCAQQDGSGNVVSVVKTWVDMPFSQVNLPYDHEVKLVGGKPILNAVVNLTFKTPAALTVTGEKYTLHAVYLYNSSLLVSRGSAEYVF